ncbi:hypothetical protein LTR42_002625 [Elasticomyces elasticus]|nr:hypothetical protein LTR42_002625 [Elasticomyces elasticus]
MQSIDILSSSPPTPHPAEAASEQISHNMAIKHSNASELPNDLSSKLSNLALSAPESPAVSATSRLLALPQEVRDLVYDFALYDAQGLDLDLITNDKTTSLQPFSVAIYTSLFLALPQTRRHELSKRPSTQHKTAIFLDRGRVLFKIAITPGIFKSAPDRTRFDHIHRSQH